MKLLTIIPYKFLPITTGGHIAHLYFHNFISKYIENYLIGTTTNNDENYNIKFNFNKLISNNKLLYTQLYYIPTVYKFAKKNKIDLIMNSHPYLGLMNFILSKLLNLKVITYSHNIESMRFKELGKWWWKILFYYEKWVMYYSQIVFFVTNEDRNWAINNYKLNSEKTKVSPFGINIPNPPVKNPKYREDLINNFNLNSETKIIYFAGSYDYFPNQQAVEIVLEYILPILSKKINNFKILIVGKGLNQDLKDKIEKNNAKIQYIGFVEDINEVLFSADLMINPMISGGGIKTKAVEALGNNIKVVSTLNGSFGLDEDACKDMLWVSNDNDWNKFADNITLALESKTQISKKFYDMYYWGNLTKTVAETISIIS